MAPLFMALCLHIENRGVNVKNAAVNMAVKIRLGRLRISMKVRLSLYQTTLFWFFPQPAVKSLDAS